MASLKDLYSYNGEEPRPLPFEISWKDSNGALVYRTNPETFTEEEIEKSGFTGPYPKPDFNITYQTLSWNSELLQWEIGDIEIESFPKYDNSESFMGNLRMMRNDRLSQSDWTQLPDCQLTDEQKVEWQTYRQQLRDLPLAVEEDIETYMNDIEAIPFPEEPK